MKRIILFIAFCLLCLSFVGCMTKEEQLSMEAQLLTKEIENLKNEIVSLEAEKDKLEDEILDTKIEYDLAKYVITIEVKRDFSMEMSALDAEIPVSKEFYNSVEIGTKLVNEYIMGNGDHFKGWFSIVVTHKEIR